MNDTTWNTASDTAVRVQLDNIVETLERELLNNQDFSESWILRHAAVNRFVIQPDLSVKERAQLTSMATSVQKIAQDNGYDIVAETMHFTKECDAQKIMKLSEGITMLVND